MSSALQTASTIQVVGDEPECGNKLPSKTPVNTLVPISKPGRLSHPTKAV
jgi:hypothetical protein